MSPPPPRITLGETLRASSRRCEWSKETTQGWVVDGLAAWGRDPRLEPFFAGTAMTLPKDDRVKILEEWRCALAAALACAPQASAHRAHQYNFDQLVTLTLRQGCLEVAIPLPPVKLSQDVLVHWAQRINTSCLLTGISQDFTKASVFIPFVSPDQQSVAVILSALKTCASEVCAILSAFSKCPGVAATWGAEVAKCLGGGES